MNNVKKDRTRDNQVNYKKDELESSKNTVVNIPKNFFEKITKEEDGEDVFR